MYLQIRSWSILILIDLSITTSTISMWKPINFYEGFVHAQKSKKYFL